MIKNKSSFLSNFRYFGGLAYRVDPVLFISNILLYVLLSLTPVISLWLLKKLMDQVIEVRAMDDSLIWFWFGLFLVTQLLQYFIQNWSAYLQQKQQGQLSAEITSRVARKASEIDYAYYENPSFFDSMHMAQQQSLYLPNQLIVAAQTLLQHLLLVISLSFFLIQLHWLIPALLLLLGIPLALSRIFFSRHQLELEMSLTPYMRKIFDFFQYLTSPLYAMETRLFGVQGSFVSRYKQIQLEANRRRNKLQHVQLRKNILLSLFEVIVSGVFYLVIIARAIAEIITLGGVIAYLQAFQRLQSSINSMYQSTASMIRHQMFLSELIRFLHLPSGSRGAAVCEVESNAKFSLDRIEINNLTFAYPGTSDYVLHGLTLSVAKGEMIAVVGHNGSGKSTLLKILCGLYEPDSRRALMFDGLDSIDLGADYFSRHVSVSFQQFGRYYLSISENVALGKEFPDAVRVRQALKDATASSFVDWFPEKEESLLGRTYMLGHELSGGQWQKIALARAMFKEAPALLLDEPTSSLDATSEKLFLDHLRESKRERITVLVTHRLQNLKYMDRIYVLHEGRLVESGSFEHLLSLDGYFNRLYTEQQI